ncbi:PhoX family protein [Propioniciclava soli]|uniref:PhoX family phosphatase n=1 Tax=Propioniciclava soli TaxID=2775081 RepID=A0ABZ3C4A9_9ACTN|nr:PhoX family phosphatase [Propioniciclava soli]
MPERRRLLNLLTPAPIHGNRSSLTCRFKCGDACFHAVPNTSDNAYFGDIAEAALSRRGVMKAGLVAAGGAAFAGSSLASFVTAPEAAALTTRGRLRGLGWTPIAPATTDAVETPDGFDQDIVIRWGDPLFAGAPAFDPHAQTGPKQETQFGYNNDYLGFLPLSKNVELMCVNHEYTDEVLMFAGYDAANPTREQVEVAWAAHGLSVVAVKGNQGNGKLKPIVGHGHNRRFTATSEFAVSGPARGSQLLQTSADPSGSVVRGTLNNCSGGLTPWGTWLTAEENFNQYFANGAAVTDPLGSRAIRRYGIPTGETERKWERFDDRFDLAEEPNEVNRFGWIVEIDPYDPTSTPVKRTLLGRFKHEAGTAVIDRRGRAVVYSGDDERFDYLYKFVSRKKVNRSGGFRGNADLLDSGTLYVARFTGDSPAAEIDGTGSLPSDRQFDGVGQWIPLCTESESFVPGMSVEEVLVYTRLAADTVGPTKMDRPEDVETNPVNHKIYMALTNNTQRGTAGKAGVDEANPRNANKHGHVIEMTETGNDPAATTFAWNILLVCGDPADPATYFGGFDKAQVSPISCPDNVTFDEHGNLWISTDGNQLGAHDGLYAVPLTGRYRGQVRQFCSVPTGAETCGPWVTERRVNICVQHPGETNDSTFENPASHWPDGGGSLPRPAVVTMWQNGRSGAPKHRGE